MKKRIKLLILKLSNFLYKNQKSKVIYYHDIHSNNFFTDMSTPIFLFKTHLEIIKNKGYKIVKNINNPLKEIEITFDDGFRGLYENFDFFVDNKIPIKVFLIVDYIGKKNYMTKKEIQELLSTGFLVIGSHTISHRNLDTLNDRELKKEILDSKLILEDMFNEKIEDLCYPRGRFNYKIIDIARNSGYKKQYSCLPGSYFEPFTQNVIKRNFVQHATPKEFEYYLNGGGEILFNRYVRQHFRDKV